MEWVVGVQQTSLFYIIVADTSLKCRNDEGVIVADYSLRLPGELCYDSSGNLFTVKEDWGDLAPGTLRFKSLVLLPLLTLVP